MSRNSIGRSWAKRFGYVLLVLLIVIGAVGVAWTNPHAATLLVRSPRNALNIAVHYVRPVDGRERVAAKIDGFDVLLLVLDACRPDKFSAYGFELGGIQIQRALRHATCAALGKKAPTHSVSWSTAAHGYIRFAGLAGMGRKPGRHWETKAPRIP
jgi:hypothetical protein